MFANSRFIARQMKSSTSLTTTTARTVEQKGPLASVSLTTAIYSHTSAVSGTCDVLASCNAMPCTDYDHYGDHQDAVPTAVHPDEQPYAKERMLISFCHFQWCRICSANACFNTPSRLKISMRAEVEYTAHRFSSVCMSNGRAY